MKAAQLLGQIVEAEEYSDWEVIQLLKEIYGADDDKDRHALLVSRIYDATYRDDSCYTSIFGFLRFEQDRLNNFEPKYPYIYTTIMTAVRNLLAKAM